MTTGAFSPAQIEALERISAVLQPFRWVLIGASAIGSRLRLPRFTNDVDFAVAASSEAVLPRLRQAGWVRHPRLTQRWQREQLLVDIVVTSEEDLLAGIVHMEDGVELCVVGFDLAFSMNDAVQITATASAPVPHLPVLVFTKMIAWMDRPDDRGKDLGDIVHIWDNALEDGDEQRWKSPIVEEDLEYGDQSAFFVGWQLGRMADAGHLHWVKRFLARLGDDESPAFAQLVRASRYVGDDVEARLSGRLRAFELGLDRGAARQHENKTIAPITPQSVQRASVTPIGRGWSLEQLLHDAIDSRRVVQFYYGGHPRIVQPHVLGTKDGRLHVLTYQIGGRSSSGHLPDWRRFFVDELSQFKIMDETFVPQPLGFGRHSAFDRQIAVVRRMWR